MASRLTLQYRRFQMSWFLKCLLLLLVQFDVLNSFKFLFLRSKYLSHLVPNANLDTIQNNEQSHALQQLIMRFNCDDIDSDIISEFLFETGSLSVSCEVESEKPNHLEEKKWSDIIKTKNWQTAILRANFPSSFDLNGLIDLIKLSYGDITNFNFEITNVENKDW